MNRLLSLAVVLGGALLAVNAADQPAPDFKLPGFGSMSGSRGEVQTRVQ